MSGRPSLWVAPEWLQFTDAQSKEQVMLRIASVHKMRETVVDINGKGEAVTKIETDTGDYFAVESFDDLSRQMKGLDINAPDAAT